MKSLIISLLAFITMSCNGDSTSDNVPISTDTLMDTAVISRKADTTVERLDNISDSIKMMREKAARESE